MATRPATELLYDSEASYRLVDSALGEFSFRRRGSEEGGEQLAPEDIKGLIREELFGLMAHLHFREVSMQELNHAARVIANMQQLLTQAELPRTTVAALRPA